MRGVVVVAGSRGKSGLIRQLVKNSSEDRSHCKRVRTSCCSDSCPVCSFWLENAKRRLLSGALDDDEECRFVLCPRFVPDFLLLPQRGEVLDCRSGRTLELLGIKKLGDYAGDNHGILLSFSDGESVVWQGEYSKQAFEECGEIVCPKNGGQENLDAVIQLLCFALMKKL